MIKPLAFGPVIRQYMMSGIPDEERYSPQGNFKEKGKGLFPSIYFKRRLPVTYLLLCILALTDSDFSIVLRFGKQILRHDL